MKRRNVLKSLFAFALTAVVLYAVSVREVHYLFSQHEAHEHCENHLHGAEHHEDCSLCKFDVSLFTDEVAIATATSALFLVNRNDCFYHSPVADSQFSSATLRGPPALV